MDTQPQQIPSSEAEGNNPENSSVDQTAPTQSESITEQAPVQEEHSIQGTEATEVKASQPELVETAVTGASTDSANPMHSQPWYYGWQRFVVALIVLLVLAGMWYMSNKNAQMLSQSIFGNQNVNITVDNNKEEGTVKIIDQGSDDLINTSTADVVNANLTTIKAYYLNSKTNPNIGNCSKVEPLDKQTERKYSSTVINTLRGLLEPLTAEQQSAGWASSIPAGVLLKSVMIRDGTAEVNFTGTIERVAGSCAVTAVRAQIEQTLKQFPGVKNVRICVDGNCNQSKILQP